MRALRTWRPDDRLSCLAAYGLILLWCFPLYSAAAGRGSIGSDWEWFLAYFEALRITVIDHGQFPGLHVWNFLGSPFWANPQIGPVSHFGLLSLLLGPLWGIKLGMLVGYLLSFESARALGRELFETPAAAVCAGLLYALNTGLAAQLTRGQITFGGYFLAPLLVLACLRLRRQRWAGASAGIVAGLCVHYGVSYFVIYTFFLCALLALVTALRQRAWGPLLRFGGLFALAFVAVAAVRLLPMLAVLSDFPRELHVPLSLNGGALARMFLVPALGPPSAWLEIGDPRHPLAIGSWEFFAYCGMGVLALTAISLRWGLRFYHVGAVLAFWLMLGARYPWQLSRWLSHVPPFHATWLPFRWRLVVLACLALAAAQGVDRLIRWSNTRPPHLRWGTRALAWVLPLELIVLLLPSWAANITPYRHMALDRQDIGLPHTDHMLAVRHVVVPGTHKRIMYTWCATTSVRLSATIRCSATAAFAPAAFSSGTRTTAESICSTDNRWSPVDGVPIVWSSPICAPAAPSRST